MRSLGFAFLIAALPGLLHTQEPDSATAPIDSTILRLLTAPGLAGARWSSIADVRADVQRAYEHVNWRALWHIDGRPSDAALAVTRLLTEVDSLGLDPADYDAADLDARTAAARATPFAGDSARELYDLHLSVSAARVLVALRWGRVRQLKAYPRSTRASDDYDLALALVAAAGASEPRVVFDQTAPLWDPYRKLLAALPGARRLTEHPLLSAPPVLRGRLFHEAPALRSLLEEAFGVLPDSAPPSPPADTLLDRSLSRALRTFQRVHRAPQTGNFDLATRDTMRSVLRNRVRRTLLTLERWRWLPRTPVDDRSIVVNVPEFRLRAYDTLSAGAEPTFDMKVVVGRNEEERFTPLFADQMEHLIFSPYWEVPTSIATKEIKPKAEKDPSYLSRNRYVLVRGYSETAKPILIDSANIARIGRSVRVRQLPGSYNALGRIKFMLPNDLNIYLHDTNEKHFFRRELRALSHGCIRVAEPVRLAEWVLTGDTTWTREKMQKAMKADTPQVARLTTHLPVMIVYHTAVVDDLGHLRAIKDVYAYDDELDALLKQSYAPRPQVVEPAAATATTSATAPAVRAAAPTRRPVPPPPPPPPPAGG